MTGNRRIHDIGGAPAGPIDTSHHDELPWHRMITAINGVLGWPDRRLICVHERRRTTEDLGEAYNRMGYFDRSVRATCDLMIEKGVVTPQEIEARMTEIRARGKGE